MKTLTNKIRVRIDAVLKNISGASLIEYAVLLGVVMAVAVGAITLVGKKVNNTFNVVQNAINT